MTETEYTNKIITLLKHMGYMEVTYNHGIDEFGKDIVFSEYDRFGNKKYHAAQVKFGNISGGNTGQMGDIINHIEKAFNIEFSDLITKTDVSISDFFLVISGKFVGSAKTMLLKNARLTPYKHRIYFYEGHHIEALFEKNFREIKELYNAQLKELVSNIKTAESIKGQLNSGDPIESIKFSDFKLTKRIDKLVELGDQLDLPMKLYHYQLQIIRCNNILSKMSQSEPNRDRKKHREFFPGDIKTINSMSLELMGLITDILAEE